MSGIHTASTARPWTGAALVALLVALARRRGVRRAEGFQAADRHHGEGGHGERERRRAARRGERSRRSLRRPDRTVRRPDRRADGQRRGPAAGARAEGGRDSDGVHGRLPRRPAQRRHRRLGAGLPVPRVRRDGRRTHGVRASAAACSRKPPARSSPTWTGSCARSRSSPSTSTGPGRRSNSGRRRHPIAHTFAGRTSGASLLTSLRSGDKDAFLVVGEVSDTLENVSERLNTYAAHLPKQARWQAELLATEMTTGLRLDRTLDDVHDLGTVARQASGVLEGIPALLDAEREILAAERRAVLAGVDGQRLQTLAVLTGVRRPASASRSWRRSATSAWRRSRPSTRSGWRQSPQSKRCGN